MYVSRLVQIAHCMNLYLPLLYEESLHSLLIHVCSHPWVAVADLDEFLGFGRNPLWDFKKPLEDLMEDALKLNSSKVVPHPFFVVKVLVFQVIVCEVKSVAAG